MIVRGAGASDVPVKSSQVTVRETRGWTHFELEAKREAGENEVSVRTPPSHECTGESESESEGEGEGESDGDSDSDSDGDGDSDGRFGDNSDSNSNSNRSRSSWSWSCNNNNHDHDTNTNTTIDVLLTHRPPPLGMSDFIPDTMLMIGGTEGINKQGTKRVLVLVRHIHEGYGCVYDGTTLYINASIMNQNYEACHFYPS